jgi:hypothetical protein
LSDVKGEPEEALVQARFEKMYVVVSAVKHETVKPAEPLAAT